jgi:hypothetical protein
MVYNNIQGEIMNQDIVSVSQSTQPHKFFERYLDNDLDSLSSELKIRYEKIKNADVLGVTPVTEADIWQESNSVSTMKWRQYNVFQFSIPEIYYLYLLSLDLIFLVLVLNFSLLKFLKKTLYLYRAPPLINAHIIFAVYNMKINFLYI